MKGIVILVIFALIGIISSENYKECDGVELGKNVPYPGNCAKYLTCIDGGEERICRRPLHFNAVKQVCDWPERANCNSNGEIRPECKDVQLGKNVPYPGNCGKFTTCIGGGEVRNCPDPLEFNAVKQVCDWPERANCKGGNNDQDKDHSGGNENGNNDQDHSGGGDKNWNGKLRPECKGVQLGKNVPYPGNCGKFTTCIGGGEVQNCPDTLEFNAEKQVCDWPERANCKGGNKDQDKDHSGGNENGNNDKDHSGGGDKNSNGKLRPECRGVQLGKNVPYPGNCGKFTTCIGGGEIQNCPDTLEFNAEKQVCDWPERANCKGGNNDQDKDHSGGNENGNNDKDHSEGGDKNWNGKLRPECKGVQLGKNVPYPGNCGKFTTCIGGGEVQNCPDKLEFNAEKQVCDWPERANCKGGNNHQDKDHSGGNENGNNDKDHSGGGDKNSNGKLRPECRGVQLGKNVPYPGNCGKFTTCIGGGEVQNCPDKLEFNAEKQVCDWPERANCKGGNNHQDKDHSGGNENGNNDKDHSGGGDKNSNGKLRPECRGVQLGKNVPYPGNCGKFTTCIGGGEVQNCPDKLEFNAEKQVCDWPERANCESGSYDNDKDHSGGNDYDNNDKDHSGGSDKNSNDKLRPECKGVEEGKNVPYPGNCGKFTTCIDGGVVRYCPDNLEFNSVKQVCDWPERAKCMS